MLFYFDMIYGLKRVRDPEGSNCSDRAEALSEAEKIIVELAIEELRRGNRLSADWRIEILDETRAVAGTILFHDVLFDPPGDELSARMLRRHFLGETKPWPPYRRSQAALEESREIVASVRNVFREIKQQLDGLAEPQISRELQASNRHV